jgi:two-component system sensor histidine kinase KdpD
MADKPIRTYLTRVLYYFLGIVGVVIMTAILFQYRDILNSTTVALLYLLPVLATTTFFGLGPGVLASFIAFLAYNYFFLVPYYTFTVHQSQDIIALVIFLIVTTLINQLVGRGKASLSAAISRERETTLLYEFSLELAGVTDAEGIAGVIIRRATETIEPNHIELRLNSICDNPPTTFSYPDENKPTSEPNLSIILETGRATFGELCLWVKKPTLDPHEEHILRTFVTQGTLALERISLEYAQSRSKVVEESERLKSALLSSVSHEFRTPLSTIKATITSLLSDKIPWDAQTRIELLSSVDEETDYLNYLVGNLLDMSRIEAGALKPERQWNVLSEIVEGVIIRMYRSLVNYHVDIDISEDLPLIPVDYVQIEQVFINLIHNSTKYSPQGSSIHIIAIAKDETSILVKVLNESPHVAPNHLDKIFDRFYRITEPERVSGIGLGLSICKGIIEAHGGRIWAENVPEGFAFIFTLPLVWDRPTSLPTHVDL